MHSAVRGGQAWSLLNTARADMHCAGFVNADKMSQSSSTSCWLVVRGASACTSCRCHHAAALACLLLACPYEPPTTLLRQAMGTKAAALLLACCLQIMYVCVQQCTLHRILRDSPSCTCCAGCRAHGVALSGLSSTKKGLRKRPCLLAMCLLAAVKRALLPPPPAASVGGGCRCFLLLSWPHETPEPLLFPRLALACMVEDDGG